jgi:hypothetical protein
MTVPSHETRFERQVFPSLLALGVPAFFSWAGSGPPHGVGPVTAWLLAGGIGAECLTGGLLLAARRPVRKGALIGVGIAGVAVATFLCSIHYQADWRVLLLLAVSFGLGAIALPAGIWGTATLWVATCEAVAERMVRQSSQRAAA